MGMTNKKSSGVVYKQITVREFLTKFKTRKNHQDIDRAQVTKLKRIFMESLTGFSATPIKVYKGEVNAGNHRWIAGYEMMQDGELTKAQLDIVITIIEYVGELTGVQQSEAAYTDNWGSTKKTQKSHLRLADTPFNEKVLKPLTQAIEKIQSTKSLPYVYRQELAKSLAIWFNRHPSAITELKKTGATKISGTDIYGTRQTLENKDALVYLNMDVELDLTPHVDVLVKSLIKGFNLIRDIADGNFLSKKQRPKSLTYVLLAASLRNEISENGVRDADKITFGKAKSALIGTKRTKVQDAISTHSSDGLTAENIILDAFTGK